MQTAEKTEVTAPQRPQLAPGWYRDLSNEDYHGSAGWSSSQIKTLLEKTPAHLLHGITVQKESTAAMTLGTAVHTLVLEPGKFEQEFAVIPKLNLRTNAGKAEMAEFEQLHEGKTLITEDVAEKAARMAESVMANPFATALLDDAVTESSVYWWYKTMDPDDDTEFKTMLKVRPDALCRGHSVIIDLKTTIDASFTGFQKSIQNFGYHVSAAMYLEGVNQCKPLLQEMGHFAYTKFLFICVENVEPYLTAIYELDQQYLDIGKALYRRGLHTLKHAVENNFPGFPEEVRIIEAPPWANRSHIV